MPSRDLDRPGMDSGHRHAATALASLARSGRVVPVRKDLFVLPDVTGRLTVGLADLIEVVAPELHLITGGRALEEHKLTNQHFFSIIVLVPGPISGFSFRGEKAVFMVTESKRIWGWQEPTPRYALAERALLDAVSHSRYGVSLPVAVGALRRAAKADPDFIERLVAAARRYNTDAVARRLGLIVDRLFGDTVAEPFVELIGASRTPVPLRPTGAKEGPIDRKWRIILNASFEPATVNA